MNEVELSKKHIFHSPINVSQQLLHGKSLWRTLLNLALKNKNVSGKIVDIGGKLGQSSYYEYLNISSSSEVIFTDIFPQDQIVYLDVEKEFPFADESLDCILAFNLFEHVYRYQLAPSEAFRTLSKGGQVLVATPFLFPYHADPDDYFRFTDSAILRIWTEVGFECVHLEAIGEGIFTMWANVVVSELAPRYIRPIMSVFLYLITTPLDRLIAKFRPKIKEKTVSERYPLGYFAIFEKP